MKYSHPRLTLLVTLLAGALSASVAFVLPLFYAAISYQYQSVAVRTEAHINANLITRQINANPTMWQYEEPRLQEILSRRPASGDPEVRKILDTDGRLVAESIEPLPWPLITASAPLYDAGRQTGTIVISRSMGAILYRMAVIMLLSGTVAYLIFLLVRTLPLRALNDALRTLGEEKERAETTLRSIGDGVIATDTNGNIVLLNPTAEQLTGWKRDEAAGRHLEDVFRIKDRIHEDRAAQQHRSGQEQELPRTVLIARDGTERVIIDDHAPIRDREGHASGMVLVFRDVTERIRMDEAITQARKLESLGILAGGIAHDFNNILTAIMGNISLAQMSSGPDQEGMKRLMDAEKACLRAKDLTYQLLTFSRGGAPIKKTTSVGEIMRETTEFALTGSRCRAEFVVPPDLWLVDADAGQLNQVVHNLVINSVEAMPQGGVIALWAENVIKEGSQPPPIPPGPYVRITVRDQGVGIPREILPMIFDPYFTTKHSGSGLGLATTYAIIRNHGGHIDVDSLPGKGTVFTVHLPAMPNASLPGTGTASSGRPLRGKGRVLVMDDEAVVRDVVGAMMAWLGYEPVLSEDGQQAIDLYQQAMRSGTPFAAVLLDLTVPGGMGGREALAKLREIDPAVRAVVSSGYSNDPVMSNYRDHGFAGIVMKPYNIEALGQALNDVLRA